MITTKQVEATEAVILCNSCSTTQYMSMMQQHHGATRNKNYTIKDLDNKTFIKYEMRYEPEVGMSYPNQRRISAAEQREFLEQAAEWDIIRYHTSEPYLSSVSVSAYDLSLHSILFNDVVADYSQNSFVGRKYSNLLLSILTGVSLAGFSANIPYSIPIELADGTKVIMKFKELQGATAKYEIVELLDSDGNEVPETELETASFSVRFTTMENFQRWFEYMEAAYGLSMNEVTLEWARSEVPNGVVFVTEIKDKKASVPPPPPPEDEEEEEE